MDRAVALREEGAVYTGIHLSEETVAELEAESLTALYSYDFEPGLITQYANKSGTVFGRLFRDHLSELQAIVGADNPLPEPSLIQFVLAEVYRSGTGYLFPPHIDGVPQEYAEEMAPELWKRQSPISAVVLLSDQDSSSALGYFPRSHLLVEKLLATDQAGPDAAFKRLLSVKEPGLVELFGDEPETAFMTGKRGDVWIYFPHLFHFSYTRDAVRINYHFYDNIRL